MRRSSSMTAALPLRPARRRSNPRARNLRWAPNPMNARQLTPQILHPRVLWTAARPLRPPASAEGDGALAREEANEKAEKEELTRLSKKSAPEKMAIENKGLFWRKLAQSGVFRQSQRMTAHQPCCRVDIDTKCKR